jgi:hypothetical protein
MIGIIRLGRGQQRRGQTGHTKARRVAVLLAKGFECGASQ